MIGVAIAIAVFSGLVAAARRGVQSSPPEEAVSAPVNDWESLLDEATWTGRRNREGTFVVVEFEDFQCPFCAAASQQIQALVTEWPDAIAIAHRHFPLSIHARAMDAAMAAECADEQGRFRQMRDVLFSRQEEFGRTSWWTFARAAGTPDSLQFTTCMMKQRPRPRIERDIDAAKRIGVSGTPTFVFDGIMVPGLGAVDSIRYRLERRAVGQLASDEIQELRVQ